MNDHRIDELSGAIECLLFASSETLPAWRLAEVLELEPEQIEAAVEALNAALEGRGLQVVHLAGGYQLGTRPEYATFVHRLLQPPPARLSAQALEVVAIIAYRQPVTRPEVDDIRGVNSQHSVATLAEKGLITTVGRKEAPGRPLLYGTTPHFLSTFGLRDLEDLPNMEAFRSTVIHQTRGVLHGISQTGDRGEDAPEASSPVDDPERASEPVSDTPPDEPEPTEAVPAVADEEAVPLEPAGTDETQDQQHP